MIAPSIGGATNFQAPSYSPATGLFYLCFRQSKTLQRQDRQRVPTYFQSARNIDLRAGPELLDEVEHQVSTFIRG